MATSSGIVGRDILERLQISFNNSTWIDFGAGRNISQPNTVETADATAAGDNDYRVVVETFVAGTLSWDGVIKTDSDGATLDRFENFFHNPALENGPGGTALSSRCLYVRFTRAKTGSQNRTKTFQIQLTSFEIGAAYDDVATYSCEAQILSLVSTSDA